VLVRLPYASLPRSWLDYVNEILYPISLPTRSISLITKSREALAQAQRLTPDLVLLDLSMPGMSSLETTRLLKACTNAPRVVILTPTSAHEYRAHTLSSEVDDDLDKSDLGAHLAPLLQALFQKRRVQQWLTVKGLWQRYPP
jgi:DNA-binding NarL/FixJ family response regulator